MTICAALISNINLTVAHTCLQSLDKNTFHNRSASLGPIMVAATLVVSKRYSVITAIESSSAHFGPRVSKLALDLRQPFETPI